MFNKIIINKSNLLHNLAFIKSKSKGAKICVMIKANAYGHGMKEIVECLKDEDVVFGVSCEEEGFVLRNYTNKKIIIFGAIKNYQKVIKKEIDFALLSFDELKDIIEVSNKIKIKPYLHLCLNSGMNRYGVKTEKEFFEIINYLIENKIRLEGLYTHFSSLTTDKNYTQTQKKKFYHFCSLLPDDFSPILHVGGGRTLFKKIKADMYRVGIEVYGYGNKNLKPVMSVESQIVDTVQVHKNEHIGYLCGYTAKEDMIVGAIPMGYADGLPRKLSNVIFVKNKNKKFYNVGNICMDCFMINTNSQLKTGDKVCIMDNAKVFAHFLETSEYEVLTNFGHARAERVVKI